MIRPPRCRCALLLALALLMTGGQPAMSAETDMQAPPRETHAVPLRFGAHDFAAVCYNTLSCSVIYNRKQFTPFSVDKPSPAPRSPEYRQHWGQAGYLGIDNFPPPAEVRWISMDGVKHEAKVDMAKLFKEQLVWHKVPKADMADFYTGPVAGEPDIFLEVNNRTISVFTKMLIPTRTEQIQGNRYSNGRDDLFLVWTRTY